MNTEYIVSLTPAEVKALEFVSLTANDWIQNAVHERCRLAMEEMVSQEIALKMASGQPISGTRDEIVLASELPSAKQRHEEIMAQIAAGPIVPGTQG